MQMTFLQRLDLYLRFSLPVALTILLAILGVVPLHAPGFAPVAPMLVLASLYYWAIYRPQMMPLILVFLVGLFHDILIGGPLGVNALAYLAAYGLVAGQRRVFLGKSFGVVWWGFMLVAGAVESLRWLLISALGGTVLDPLPGFFTYVSSVGVYPLLSLLFSSVHKLIPTPEH